MGRRKKGYKGPEGLIKMRNSRNWYAKKTINGKTLFRSTRTADLLQAQRILHSLMTELLKEFELHTVNRILGRSVCLSEIITRYLHEVSPSKSGSGRNDINSSKPVLVFFGESKIDGITIQDIYKYLDWRKNSISLQTGHMISGATVNREKSFLSKIFKFAIRCGYINENPVTGVEGYSERRRERYITDDEFDNILNAMSSDNKDMFLSLYHTSVRTGRIYNLEWHQIDIENRIITFVNTNPNKRVPEKLYINDTLLDILSRRKRARRTLTPHVFYKPTLKPFSEFDALKIWKAACEKVEVQDCTPRDIRHKALTDMGIAGFDLSRVGHVAGHSDPRTTKRYTHFSAAETKEPLQALVKRKKEMANGKV